MKSFVAVIAAIAIASASAADCDILKLSPLVKDENAAKCTADSGYSFIPPSKPTDAVFPKVCASTACKAVLKVVSELGLGDCTVTIANPPLLLDTDLVKAFEKGCAKLGGGAASTGSGSGAGNSSTIKAPAATTAAPVATSKGADNSTTSSATTPAPTTPAPTNSAASSLAIASGAVVLAVAAAFM